jgi:cysteine synthase A
MSNFKAHYTTTGPELFEQLDGKIDYLVSAAGTGGTISGTSTFLKEKIPNVKVALVDPDGSGLHSFLTTGEFKSQGSSITEGIGIMRLVSVFKQCVDKKTIDESFNIHDKDLVTVANYVRDHDDMLLGSSSALNVSGAFKVAMENQGKGLNIVTFWCDGGERSMSKLYNAEFLKTKNLDQLEDLGAIAKRYELKE